MITHELYLNMVPGVTQPARVALSQYDDDFSIVFHLIAVKRGIVPPYPSTITNDTTFVCPSGTTAEIRGTKTDGNGYSASATVNVTASTVTVTGAKQMTAVAGDNIFEVVLYYSNKELSSANFILEVEKAAMDDTTIVSDSVVRELMDVIDEADDIIAAAQQVEDALSTIDTTLSQQGKAAEAKATGTALTGKVDKVTGKGLSTEDYTTAEKTKLAGIATGATATTIDSTLTQSGAAADAKAVGDALADLSVYTFTDANNDGNIVISGGSA